MNRWAILALIVVLAACGNRGFQAKEQAKRSDDRSQHQLSATNTKIPANKYVVKSGESVQDIANRHHVSLEDLLRANPDLQRLVGGGDSGGGGGAGDGIPGRDEQGQPGAPQSPIGVPDGRLNDPLPKDKEVTIPSNEALTGYELDVLNLTNAERRKAGLQPFSGNDTNLNRSARAKAQDMAVNNYFSHTSPTYGDPFAMMRSFGVQYQAAGENIAKGQPSPEQVVQAWMNSPGHRANILNEAYTHMGVGYVANEGQPCWTQQFVAK
ncbi:CAP domain-containing protein [Cohnella hongkongensis]|uniref:CAP domain-containing protein n=1 Tax=Cohnella hongkongensis TaxID=178337 RepID=A0ABV9FB91_9BACL